MNGQLLKVYHPGLNRMVYVDSRNPRKMVTADSDGYLIRHTEPNHRMRRQGYWTGYTIQHWVPGTKRPRPKRGTKCRVADHRRKGRG